MKITHLKESFGTLSETINELIKLGYIHDFNIPENIFNRIDSKNILDSKDFQIDKVYRFEGQSNPEDQSILYAISSSKFRIKGTLVNGYGTSSNEEVSKIIEKLETNTEPS
jgi:hypothetical protein